MTMIKTWAVAIGVLCCASGLLYAQVDDPNGNFGIKPTRSIWSGVYSAAQAQRGEGWYQLDECGSCHDEPASGVAMLVGADFLNDWDGQSALALARHIHSSPMGLPGDIRLAEATELIAYILKENGIPAGTSDLSSDPHALARIRMDALKPAGR